jgi:hypothetical protein
VPDKLVGRVGVEPTTSRLSGVRSNHLSYRPSSARTPVSRSKAAPYGRASQRWPSLSACDLADAKSSRGLRFPVMKGHEDGGICSVERREALPSSSNGAFEPILRKEVIQPQVPLRLPCYDFTPVANPTVVACLSCELAQRLRVKPTPMV